VGGWIMSSEVKENKYLIGEYNNEVFIKFIGNATMKNSKTLEEAFNNIFAGEKKDIILDFEECNYMDSTMLGLIAKTAIRLKKEWNQFLYEINSSNMVKTSLKSTGVYNLMKHLDDLKQEVELKELENKDFDDKTEKAKHILEAHKTLMDLSDENKKIFKNVVEMLEKDLDK
jgi:anti-anti-sigma factor